MVIRKALSHLGESIEELILLGIIILNFFDFIEIVSPDWDYAKKILSLTAVCYLLYRASLTRLFLGTQKKGFDILIIISYLALSFKNMVGYSVSAMGELAEKGAGYWANLYPLVGETLPKSRIINITSPLNNIDLAAVKDVPVEAAIDNLTRAFTISKLFPPEINGIYVRVSNDISSIVYFIEPKYLIHRWHNFILDNLVYFQKTALLIGFVMLLLITLYFALRVKINSPSLLNVIHEDGEPPRNVIGFLVRFLTIFAALNFFYIAVFNLVIEWLALAVDTPLIIIGVLFYFLIWIKHHSKFKTQSLIYKIGNFGESFIERFMELFHSQRELLLGLSGMLVLHLLTDIGNFLLPYTIGLKDQLYFMQLGPGHSPLFSIGDIFTADKTSLFFLDAARTMGIWNVVEIGYIYIMNLLAVFMVFIGPAFIWYILFDEKSIKLRPVHISLFYASLLVFLATPVMSIGRVLSNKMVGVDIQTFSLIDTAIYNLSFVFFASILVGALFYVLAKTRFAEKLNLATILIIFYFFGMYVYHFFVDTSSYYIGVIVESLQMSEYAIAAYFLVFLTMTILFYIGGFFSYVYECFN